MGRQPTAEDPRSSNRFSALDRDSETETIGNSWEGGRSPLRPVQLRPILFFYLGQSYLGSILLRPTGFSS